MPDLNKVSSLAVMNAGQRCGGIAINGSWPPKCCEVHLMPWGHELHTEDHAWCAPGRHALPYDRVADAMTHRYELERRQFGWEPTHRRETHKPLCMTCLRGADDHPFRHPFQPQHIGV